MNDRIKEFLTAVADGGDIREAAKNTLDAMDADGKAKTQETQTALPERIKRPQGSDWVDCPICGESDMHCATDEEGYSIIGCTNLNCGSNGGTNFSAISHLFR